MRERLCDQLPGNVLQADLLIPQRERVAKIPADGTQNELGFGLSPLEDRRLGRHSGLFRLPAPVTSDLATQPGMVLSRRLVAPSDLAHADIELLVARKKLE